MLMAGDVVPIAGEGVIPDENRRLLVLGSDVTVDLGRLDPPLAPSADLDSAEIASPHQCIDLAWRGVQNLGYIGQGEKAVRFDVRHDMILARRNRLSRYRTPHIVDET
jgi:hypothetical protein